MALLGIGIGILLYEILYNIELRYLNILLSHRLISLVVLGIIFGLIFYFISNPLYRLFMKQVNELETSLSNIPPSDVLIGSAGLVVGLIIAFLLSQVVLSFNIPIVSNILSVMLYLLFGFIGIRTAMRNKDAILNLRESKKQNEKPKQIEKSPYKILDTSVIIDGRILEIIQTGFLEGILVIPTFVLEELQHIADSSDALKRNRGRRGLDILNEIQKENNIETTIYDKKMDDIDEVDSKIMKLALIMNAEILTNDYNLNKVAEVQGIKVLNINELANAVKPIALPGENMTVQVVKEGKELNQGLAYLDDGTMIVIEDGKNLIGETIDVIVTSVLQTAAGKMIFAKPKNKM
ncbi:MAG: PIN/TRAM domain-containing protein [Tissierellia bacterium]|nr:PIN/TRAM domain-containing protein [Tissierellia bacterium]